MTRPARLAVLWIRRAAVGSLAAAALAPASGQIVHTWDGGPDSSYDGSWSTPVNWNTDGTVPGPLDTARFNAARQYAVSLIAHPAARFVEVNAGDVRFDFAPLSELHVGDRLSVHNATLRITNGQVTAGDMSLRDAYVRLDGGTLKVTGATSPERLGSDAVFNTTIEGHGRLEANLNSFGTGLGGGVSFSSSYGGNSTLRADGGDLTVDLTAASSLSGQTQEQRTYRFLPFSTLDTQANLLKIVVVPGGSGGTNTDLFLARQQLNLAGGTLEVQGSLVLGDAMLLQASGVVQADNFISISGMDASLAGDLAFRVNTGRSEVTVGSSTLALGGHRLTVEADELVSRGFETGVATTFTLDGGSLVTSRLRFSLDSDAPLPGLISGHGLVHGLLSGTFGGFNGVPYDPATSLAPTGAVDTLGAADLGAGGLTVLTNAPTTIAGPVTLAGGELRSTGGWILGPGGSIAGAGVVLGALAGLEQVTAAGALAAYTYFGGSGQTLLLSEQPVVVSAPSSTANGTTTSAPVALDGGLLWSTAGVVLQDVDLSGTGELRGPVAGTGSLDLGGELRLGEAQAIHGVAYDGAVAVGGHTLVLADADHAQLGGAVTLAGGRIEADNGVAFGGSITGAGTVAGAVAGSGVVTATGPLTLGDAARADGYAFAGTLAAGSHAVTLLDADRVELGSQTTLAGGVLESTGGFLLPLYGNLSGNGLLLGPIYDSGTTFTITPSGGLQLAPDLAVGQRIANVLSEGPATFLGAVTLAGGTVQPTWGNPASAFVLDGAGSLAGHGILAMPLHTTTRPVTAAGGTLELARGAVFGTGPVVAESGARLLFSGGTFEIGAGGVEVGGAGAFEFREGTLTGGPLTVAAGRTLVLSGVEDPPLNTTSAKTIDVAVTNHGTIAWQRGEVLGTGSLDNHGLLAITAGGIYTPGVPQRDVWRPAITNQPGALITLDAVGTTYGLEIGALANAGGVQIGAFDHLIVSGAYTGAGTVEGGQGSRLTLTGGGAASGLLAADQIDIRGAPGTTFTVANAATNLAPAHALSLVGGELVLDGLPAMHTFTYPTFFGGGSTLTLPGVTELHFGADVTFGSSNGFAAAPHLPAIPLVVDAGARATVVALNQPLTMGAGTTLDFIAQGTTDVSNSATIASLGTINLLVFAYAQDVYDPLQDVFVRTATPRAITGGGHLISQPGGQLNITFGEARGFSPVPPFLSQYTTAGRIEQDVTNHGNAVFTGTTADTGGRATLDGLVVNTGTFTFAGNWGGIEEFRQTAGTTTLADFALSMAGGPFSVLGGLLTVNNATIGGPLVVGAGAVARIEPAGGLVRGAVEVAAGGTLRVQGPLGLPLASAHAPIAGRVVLDGPGAVLLNEVGVQLFGVPDEPFLAFAGAPIITDELDAILPGGTLEVTNGASLTSGRQVQNEGLILVGPGGTVTRTHSQIAGPGTVQVTSGGHLRFLAWFDASGPGLVQVDAGGRLTINVDQARGVGLYDRQLVNAGTVDHLAGPLIMNGATVITNQGTWNHTFTRDTSYIREGPTPGGEFRNEGTFNKDGAHTLTIGSSAAGPSLSNSGEINVNAGALNVISHATFTGTSVVNLAAGASLGVGGDGTTATFEDGARFQGPGTLGLGATATLNGHIHASNASFGGGTLLGTHTLHGTWTMGYPTNSNGQANLANTGSTTIASGGVWNFNGHYNGVNRLYGHTFVNEGTVNHNASAIGMNAATTITNRGTWNAQLSSDASFTTEGGQTPGGAFLNEGRFVKTGPGTFSLDYYSSIGFSNTGTVEVQLGTVELYTKLAQHVGTTLTGGTWIVRTGAALRESYGAGYTVNQADVTLYGTGRYDDLNNLTRNEGTLRLLEGKTFTALGAITNTGTLQVGAGSTFSTPGALTNTGVLDITGTLTVLGGLTNSGAVGGSGVVVGSLVSAGALSPGNSPGILAVQGDLTLLETSTLTLEIGGTIPGLEHDRVDVTGLFTRGGALEVTLLGAFTPGAGSSFDLFNVASFGGSFTAVALPTLPYGLVWDTADLFQGGLLSVVAVPEPATSALLACVGAAFLALRRRMRR